MVVLVAKTACNRFFMTKQIKNSSDKEPHVTGYIGYKLIGGFGSGKRFFRPLVTDVTDVTDFFHLSYIKMIFSPFRPIKSVTSVTNK